MPHTRFEPGTAAEMKAASGDVPGQPPPRAGTTPHMTRFVLGVGLLLVIGLFALILFIAR